MKIIKIEGTYYCENEGVQFRLKEHPETKTDKKTGLPVTKIHLTPEKREDVEKMGGRKFVVKSKVDKDIQECGYHWLAPHTERVSSTGKHWRDVLPNDLKEELVSLEIRLEEIKEIGREIAARPLTEEEKAQRELKKTIENLKKMGVNVEDLLKSMKV